jgi:hypothetical protein
MGHPDACKGSLRRGFPVSAMLARENLAKVPSKFQEPVRVIEGAAFLDWQGQMFLWIAGDYAEDRLLAT